MASNSMHTASRPPLTLQNNSSEPLSMTQRPDETPIPATITLVKLFESQTSNSTTSSGSRLFRERKLPPQIASLSKTALTTGEGYSKYSRPTTVEDANNSIEGARPPIRESGCISRSNVAVKATASVVDPFIARPKTLKQVLSQSGPPPSPPPSRGTHQDRHAMKPPRNGRSSLINDSDRNSSASSYASALDVIESPRASGGLSPTREFGKIRATRPSATAERFLSTNSPSPLQPKSPRIRRDSDRENNVMAHKRTLKEGSLLPNRPTPQLTADSLANAMVASSLASSRAPSPSKPAPPLPRRHPKPHSFFKRSQSQEQVASRTPSPGRSMRQTMRESPKPEEDNDEYKRRGGHPLKKHPNKHHEGDRKRWRDQLTDQERKRYEGVWAANKGLCMPSNDATSAATVLNLVVRDIWRRSRLPDDVLEEIWDLVDGGKSGKLGKEEFVVGLWLIDQRLKGRKLPIKVSESVWFSVRSLSGIKISKNPR